MKSDCRGKPFDEPGPLRLAWNRVAGLARSVLRRTSTPAAPRLLFLDDDPQRAETFLAEHPQAVWVETVPDCVDRLRENWDEVHLDHDLGGRQLVGSEEVDSGMEVIRWMCKEPREHLPPTRFFVHTHNLVAGLMMVLQMRSSGFSAEFRPFGHDLAKVLAHNEPGDDRAEPDGAWAEAGDRKPSGIRFWQWLTGKTGRVQGAHGRTARDAGGAAAATGELPIAGPDCILSSGVRARPSKRPVTAVVWSGGCSLRTVITGGAGFIGSHLCERFLDDGSEVICVDNLLTGTRRNIAALVEKPGFRFIEHNVSEAIEIDGPVDNVLHFASPASPVDYLTHPIPTLKVGSLGTHNALGLAKAKDARFLLASTSEVYGDPEVHPQREDYWGNVNPIGPRGCYDEAKRFAEAITMAYHRYHGVKTRHRADLQHVWAAHAARMTAGCFPIS